MVAKCFDCWVGTARDLNWLSVSQLLKKKEFIIMKKTLLGLLFSAGLVASMGLTASAADEPQISNGTVGFEGGDVTIDNGDTDLKGASLDFGTNKITNSSVDDNYNTRTKPQ